MTHKPLHNPDISRNLVKGQWSIWQIYKVLEKKWYYSIRELSTALSTGCLFGLENLVPSVHLG